jgi:hypothetical protein
MKKARGKGGKGRFENKANKRGVAGSSNKRTELCHEDGEDIASRFGQIDVDGEKGTDSDSSGKHLGYSILFIYIHNRSGQFVK